jgi:tRNA dimethylallyltransferase
MAQVFCIAGPTAVGKSELAADVAVRLGAEIISADAFQIYAGFDVLSGKPDAATLAKVPHHLIGNVPPTEQMSAARYRELAMSVIEEIKSRGKRPLLVGGGGLYIKSVTVGLDDLPSGDPQLREALNQLDIDELKARLTRLDPASAQRVDLKNRRRLVRAIEIAILAGQPASERRSAGTGRRHEIGVFVFRDREELYQRINTRVETMLRNGAIDEVRNAGRLSGTAEQMIGVGEIRKYLAGEMSLAECTSAIQQDTRRYAKRQLTWFRHQTTLEALNLSLLNHNEAVERVVRQAVAGARGE